MTKQIRKTMQLQFATASFSVFFFTNNQKRILRVRELKYMFYTDCRTRCYQRMA